MKITEDYKNNIKELEKFLCTFNFPEESENRIRKYIENPRSVVNDDIKALMDKYDDQIVDFRIPLPSTMIREKSKANVEIQLIMAMIVDCLEEDDQFKYEINGNNIIPKFSVTPTTLSGNFFKIKNDKRKIWKYLDTKAISIAKRAYERWYEKKSFDWDNSKDTTCEVIVVNSSALRLGPFMRVMTDYVNSVGSRNTSLKSKINKFYDSNKKIDVTGKSHSEIINILAENIYRPLLNIMQEIISVKMLDVSKYKVYLSFNAFDWLLASSAESWHSCIDMRSSYGYGAGLLGMCGCPDWGMLFYTDGVEKELAGIKSLHLITRSWVCYTNQKDYQLINWYPKDMRDTIEFANSEEFRFYTERCRNDRRSMSTWDPISFSNGAIAWIYSDSNRFNITDDRKKVYFTFEDSCGLPYISKYHGSIVKDRGGVESVVSAITRNYSSILDAVEHGFVLDDEGIERKRYRCDSCGCTVDDEDDLTYIESEDICVCSQCLENDYFWCERCESYHRYEGDSFEVYTGPESWDYNMVCERCINDLMSSGEIFYDELNERYYYDDVPREVFHWENGDATTVSKYSIDAGLRNGTVFQHADGEYYEYAEEGEESND